MQADNDISSVLTTKLILFISVDQQGLTKPIRPSSFELESWQDCWIPSPGLEPCCSVSTDKRDQWCSAEIVQIVSRALVRLPSDVALVVAAAQRLGLGRGGGCPRSCRTGEARYVQTTLTWTTRRWSAGLPSV